MKKLFIMIISLFFITSAYASDKTNMRVKINGIIKSTEYICVSNVGCVNLAAASKGRTFPMHTGEVSHVFLVDSKTLRMYPQPLPASCNINITSNQSLIILGKVARAANNEVYINHLQCTVKTA